MPFFAVLLVLFVVCHLFVPETKGRSHDEVLELMHARRRAACGEDCCGGARTPRDPLAM